MKRHILLYILSLNIGILYGQHREIYVPLESVPENGLFVAMSDPNDLILGQQRAIADALVQFILSQESELENVSSITKKEGNCEIHIIERKLVNEVEYILFQIKPSGEYAYSIETQRMSELHNSSVSSASFTLIKLGIKNIVWEYYINEKLKDYKSEEINILSSISYKYTQTEDH